MESSVVVVCVGVHVLCGVFSVWQVSVLLDFSESVAPKSGCRPASKGWRGNVDWCMGVLSVVAAQLVSYTTGQGGECRWQMDSGETANPWCAPCNQHNASHLVGHSLLVVPTGCCSNPAHALALVLPDWFADAVLVKAAPMSMVCKGWCRGG